jgi:intracellular multiplication protein IcmM
MLKQNLDDVKTRKNFYRNLFRRSVKLTLIMGVLAITQAALIFFLYITRPEPDYYSTSGVAAPMSLTAMNAPNMRSEPLLQPDLPDEMSQGKSIPQ